MKLKVFIIVASVVFLLSLGFNGYILFQTTEGYKTAQRQMGFGMCEKQVKEYIESGKFTVNTEKLNADKKE